MKQLIIVVEDALSILELIKYNLKRNGFAVIGCANGEEALEIIKSRAPDL